MNPHCYEGFLLGQMRSSVRIPADPRATAVRRSQSQNARTAQVDTRLISYHRNLRDKAFMLIKGSTYLRIQFSDCKFLALPTRDSFFFFHFQAKYPAEYPSYFFVECVNMAITFYNLVFYILTLDEIPNYLYKCVS